VKIILIKVPYRLHAQGKRSFVARAAFWFAFFTCLCILYLILLSVDAKSVSVKQIVVCGKSDFPSRAYVTVSR
jgi:hypothetical protein